MDYIHLWKLYITQYVARFNITIVCQNLQVETKLQFENIFDENKCCYREDYCKACY